MKKGLRIAIFVFLWIALLLGLGGSGFLLFKMHELQDAMPVASPLLTPPNDIALPVFGYGKRADMKALHGEFFCEIGRAPGPGRLLLLSRNRTFTMNGISLTHASLVTVLRRTVSQQGSSVPLFVWADSAVPMSAFRPVVEATRQAGLYHIRMGGMMGSENLQCPVYRDVHFPARPGEPGSLKLIEGTATDIWLDADRIRTMDGDISLAVLNDKLKGIIRPQIIEVDAGVTVGRLAQVIDCCKGIPAILTVTKAESPPPP